MEKFKKWIKAAGIRAIKTVAQTAVAMIGTSTVVSAVDWRVVASASILAGVVSLLTSVKGLPEINNKKYPWITAAGFRAIKTVAQTAVATIGTTAIISAVDWRVVASTAILSGVLSLLTSAAGIPEATTETK